MSYTVILKTVLSELHELLKCNFLFNKFPYIWSSLLPANIQNLIHIYNAMYLPELQWYRKIPSTNFECQHLNNLTQAAEKGKQIIQQTVSDAGIKPTHPKLEKDTDINNEFL